jgi:hypothetical protein
MKQRDLVGRDLALASLMGGLAAGGDFGGEMGFGFGDDDDDDVGDDYGDDGDDVGFGGKHRAARPTPHAMAKAWTKHSAMKKHHNKRVSMLDPNIGSPTKIERYSLALSQTLVLGTGGAFDTNMSGNPATTFRPQILTVNAPVPGFMYIASILVANVAATVGSGQEDAFSYGAMAQLRQLDLPTLSPANRIQITGSMTTFVPPGYTAGANFIASASFKGPSLLAGGGMLGI